MSRWYEGTNEVFAIFGSYLVGAQDAFLHAADVAERLGAEPKVIKTLYQLGNWMQDAIEKHPETKPVVKMVRNTVDPNWNPEPKNKGGDAP